MAEARSAGQLGLRRAATAFLGQLELGHRVTEPVTGQLQPGGRRSAAHAIQSARATPCPAGTLDRLSHPEKRILKIGLK
jgi:hypothetical protein